MRNIEIKARLGNLSTAEATANALPEAVRHADIRQVDTYFQVPNGRLKLREITGDQTQA